MLVAECRRVVKWIIMRIFSCDSAPEIIKVSNVVFFVQTHRKTTLASYHQPQMRRKMNGKNYRHFIPV